MVKTIIFVRVRVQFSAFLCLSLQVWNFRQKMKFERMSLKPINQQSFSIERLNLVLET